METLKQERRSNQELRRYVEPVGLLLVCAIASAPLWIGPGILYTHAGGDSPFLLQRTFELVANLRSGVFPARWMPDAAYGLGYPFFNYYAALPYYVAALINLLGFDLLTAIKLTQSLGMLAAALTAWVYARTLLPRTGAWLASAAYTLAPYHLANLYVRGDSLQEFWAFAWYPLILWGVDRVLRYIRTEDATLTRPAVSATVILSISLCALVLTHNVSALIFAPFIMLYALARLLQQAAVSSLRSAMRGAIWLGFAAGLALALSAWFWLPALGEAGGVQLTNQTTGYLDFNNHFHSANLVQSAIVFDYSVNAALDTFALALPQVVLMLAGVAVWLLRAHRRLDAWLVSGMALLAAVMITPLSKPVWDAVPGLALAQFPWRFLSVQALFGALLIGGMAHGLGMMRDKYTQIVRVACVMGISVLLLLSVPGIPNERLRIEPQDVTPETLQFYEWFSGNIGTTIRAEYLPVTAQPRPFTGPDLTQQGRHALAISGEVRGSRLVEKTPASQEWQIDVASDRATFILPLTYWAGWTGSFTDGQQSATWQPVNLEPDSGTGWVSLTLPQGEHTLRLALTGTPLQRSAEILSLLTLIGVGVVLGAFAWTARSRFAQVIATVGVGLGIALLTVVLAAIVNISNAPTAPPIQSVDFANYQFPHRAPIVFRSAAGDTYELTHATIEPMRLRAGERFTVTTIWKDQHAPPRFGVQQELASGGQFAALFRYARTTDFTADAISTHIALTNALPGPLLVRALALDDAGNELTPTIDGKPVGPVFLTGLTVTEPAPTADIDNAQRVRVFPNGIELSKIDWYQPSGAVICFRAAWAAMRPLVAAWQVSYQLRDSAERVVAQADTQPQAGLAPTWSWRTGVEVLDSPCVATIQPLAEGEPYTLRVRWYRVADQQTLGELALVGERNDEGAGPYTPRVAITEHEYALPERGTLASVTFGDSLRLLAYDVITTTDALDVTLWWSSTAAIAQDYKLFVHLAPLTTTEPVRQVDRYTLDGRYPTGMWLPREVVTEQVRIDLSAVPAGIYQLAIGWYDPQTLMRLAAVSSSGNVEAGRYVLLEIAR